VPPVFSAASQASANSGEAARLPFSQPLIRLSAKLMRAASWAWVSPASFR
jgi:hypothetical protein